MGRWNRRRKRREKNEKSGREDRRGDGVYNLAVQKNAAMEAYYAYQGLFNSQREHVAEDEDSKMRAVKFVPCTSDEEKSEEKARFLSSLRSTLPASFRIGVDCPLVFREQFIKEVEEHAGEAMEIEVELGCEAEPISDTERPGTAPMVVKKTIAPAQKIPFVPHAYQLCVDRKTIRRNPALQEFHDWLKIQTSAGFITRQETVSMIPPVVLGVQRHHYVLDMCAAPGSKTSQMLEIVSEVASGEREPCGFVVANDREVKRAYMLVHQLRRINSPALFVTSCDAQFFPRFGTRKGSGDGIFDRVLCDVPCSGDGTARKNPGIFRFWSQLGSLALHPMQIGIALAGARLAKVGGYICYSTCSMNPIENEAVVAEILRLTDGSLELVDRRSELPGLSARPGWSSWKVMNGTKKSSGKGKNSPKMIRKRAEWAAKRVAENGTERGQISNASVSLQSTQSGDSTLAGGACKTAESSFCAAGTEEVETSMGDNGVNSDSRDDPTMSTDNVNDDSPSSDVWDEESLKKAAIKEGLIPYETFEDVPEEMRKRVKASCFPPTDDEKATMHLERCMRCLPHDMNTGGFFIALLKKTGPIGAAAQVAAGESKAEKGGGELAVADADASAENASKKNKRKGTRDVADPEDESKKSRTEDDDGSGDAASFVRKKNPSDEDIGVTLVDDGESACNKETQGLGVERNNGPATNQTIAKTDGSPTAVGDEEKASSRSTQGATGKTRGGDLSNSDFVPVDTSIWPSLVDFYGLSPDFPKNQFMARESGMAKVMYFITRAVKESLIDGGIQRTTVVNSGLKAFAKNNKDCDVKYRVTQGAIQFVAPFMTKRKLSVNARDFSVCLNTGNIWLGHFSTSFSERIKPLSPGAVVVALEGFEDDIAKKMYMVMWRCRGDSLNCLVSKEEMDGIASKLRALGKLEKVDISRRSKDSKEDLVDKDVQDDLVEVASCNEEDIC